MCGRFTLRTSLNFLTEHFLFRVSPDISLPQKYNIAPTHSVATLTAPHGQRQLHWMHWGLIPSWSKDSSRASRMINARSETLHEKPSFRQAFQKRRCLILADGYYEWRSSGTDKQPFFIHRSDHKPFAFAGLWESWTPRQTSMEAVQDTPQPWHSTTIITTAAHELAASIHHRMPVILNPNDYDRWLADDDSQLDMLQSLLVDPHNFNEMTSFEMTAVSRHVNKVDNDNPQCIEPATTQQELF
ncbi:MAG: SOS response-associated peptidase [Pirellulales bacterium]|jgi:putative SOS response-associated peptidase YedK